MTELDFHPAANIFPMLRGEEYEALKADIAANGQREPIWLHPDGRILDGRNRYVACCDLGIQPKTRRWDGQGGEVAFVVSLNLARRHLTASQRAALAVDVLPMLEEEARERQAHGQTAPGKTVPEIIPEASKGEARDHAAEMFNTNGRYVQDAKSIATAAPELFEAVKTGEMTIPQAKREIVSQQRRESPPLPSDKYRIIYADPPWSYGNSGIIGDTDNYGHVHRHYPSMTIDELCAMGVDIAEMAERNAVLFMWVTSPLLEDAFAVVRAWGFKYKTSFVWDKVKHNFGHYNSVRHELLLVCTRGSCTPDNPELIDSVQTIERSDKHSEKPSAFRDIIDRLYPHGRRIELFARTSIANWEVWGNE